MCSNIDSKRVSSNSIYRDYAREKLIRGKDAPRKLKFPDLNSGISLVMRRLLLMA
jgi:hypothetical protein